MQHKIRKFNELIGKYEGSTALVCGSGPNLDDLPADFWHAYDFIVCSNLVLYTPAHFVLRRDSWGCHILNLLDGYFYHFIWKGIQDKDAFVRDGRLLLHEDSICTCVSIAVELGASKVVLAGCDFDRNVGFARKRKEMFPKEYAEITDKMWYQIVCAKEALERYCEGIGIELVNLAKGE